MVYQYVSINNIIESLYRDFGHQEELDILDVYEWAAEAMDLIGASPQYAQSMVDLQVTDHTVCLPCGFKALQQISYNGQPMVQAMGTMMPGWDSTDTTNYVKGVEVEEDNFPLSTTVMQFEQGHSFYIEDGKLKTSLECDCVTMAYLSIPLDDEGYPKVPDIPQYKRAVTEYCQMMMDRRAWRAQRIPEAVFRDTEQKWFSFMKQARVQAIMPDISKMEEIKNQWVRLKPRLNDFKNFFNTINMREAKRLR